MTNKIDEIIVNAEQRPEQDRFSMVLNATYQQWDAAPTSVILRLGRLVDEAKSPLVFPKLVIKEGSRVTLETFHLKNSSCEICIQNKTKAAPLDPNDPKAPPYLVLYRGDDTIPFAFNRLDRVTWLSPTGDIQVKAVNGDITIAYYGFPE
jgi:hypothetical protein